ncbi:unnamed protein product [Polarella glacialis]|uniref:Pentacotripeptide-repeat region of PRORP domain-containing protein n=1 Tax=Polarella glacialis TaxID=89957 RepID=A0A813IQ74_POLGL|nr:unnamed protein product [Polarella glacialis]
MFQPAPLWDRVSFCRGPTCYAACRPPRCIARAEFGSSRQTAKRGKRQLDGQSDKGSARQDRKGAGGSNREMEALVGQLTRQKTASGIAEAVARLRDGGHLRKVHEYTSVVVTWCRAQCWHEACEVLREMRSLNLKPKPVAYNNAMNACLKAKEWETALGLMGEMKLSSSVPDVFSYSAAIGACGRVGQWLGALSLLGDMQDQELAPDIWTYNAAVIACEKGSQWEWALKLVARMRQADLEPDDITYRAACRAFERGEQQLRELRLRVTNSLAKAIDLRSAEGVEQQKAMPVKAPFADCSLHFCIFQLDEQGLGGWSLEAGGKNGRWDTLLLGLLQCLMMDGQWLQNVCASAFVGPDAIHVSGDVQGLVMRSLGQGSDGKDFYQPATVKAWEETLWSARGQDSKGLSWQTATEQPESKYEARATLLTRLDEMLEQLPADGGARVLAFAASGDTTYDELKARGVGRQPYKGRLFVLLGGAHGFDGDDDRDGGAFFDAVLGRFAARFGPTSVARVNLCEPGAPKSKGKAAVFPLSKVAGFVSVEHARGALASAVSGIQATGEGS